MRTFISFEEARAIVLDAAISMGTERLPFDKAMDRTLAEDIVSEELIPPFDNSAMDGFAVCFVDTLEVPARLSVIADIPAGTEYSGEVGSGQTARIMTGAPVPRGADAIVPVEHTRPADESTVDEAGDAIDDSTVWIDVPAAQGAHVRRAGEDLRPGDTVLISGCIVTPPVVGMLATLGVSEISVARRPRVAVISTGDEIVPVSQKPGPGQIRNSNGPTLAAQVVSAGAEATCVLHVADDPRAIEETIAGLQDVDLMVFSGGVSMGDYDYVRTELDRMGAVWEFWKVRQRPGKPLAFGTLGGTPVVGLPGNPVSSSICFEMYVRPMIAKMLGRNPVFRPLEPALLLTDTPKVEALYTFTRGALGASPENAELCVSNTGNQSSNRVTSLVAADCIIHLPDGMAEARAGTRVMIERLCW